MDIHQIDIGQDNAVEQYLTQLGIAVTARQIEQFDTYIALLQKWARVFNLIAEYDRETIILHHLFDSIAIIPYLKGRRLIDVGTGAGLPGIPLAIIETERRFVLLDANGKKTRFLQQVIAALKLGNVSVVQHRVQMYQPQDKYDTLLSRAFASVYDTVIASQHLLTSQGQFQLMKSRKLDAELALLPKKYQYNTVELMIPLRQIDRYLVNIMMSTHSEPGLC